MLNEGCCWTRQVQTWRMSLLRVVGPVVAALLLTSACTVESGGSVGLTKDAQGHLLAVVVMCRGYVDGLTVYRDDTANSDSHANDRGKWESESPIRSEATLNLSVPGVGWKSIVPFAPLAMSQEFRIYAWTKANKWSADGPTFRATDLGRLDGDHILFGPSEAKAKQTDHGLIPRAQFRALACG